MMYSQGKCILGLKKLFIITIIIFAIILPVMTYKMGVARGLNAASYSLDIIQAEKAYIQVKRYTEIEKNIKNGCIDIARKKLRHSIDENMMILAEYIQNKNSNHVKDYMFSKDQELLRELKNYNVDWQKSWIEKECE